MLVEITNLSLAVILLGLLKVLFDEYKKERDRNNSREKESIKALSALEDAIRRNTETIEKYNENKKL